jgi:hypothetical protein
MKTLPDFEKWLAREEVAPPAETPMSGNLDPSSLNRDDFIEWLENQTPHRLTDNDEGAIISSGISGLVFLKYGTRDFLLDSGISRGSSYIMSDIRSRILGQSGELPFRLTYAAVRRR